MRYLKFLVLLVLCAVAYPSDRPPLTSYGVPRSLRDLNQDGVVNQTDLAIFNACMYGPGESVAGRGSLQMRGTSSLGPNGPAVTVTGYDVMPCDTVDLDRDGDVDMDDFARFQRLE
jgi:hypothetical protein